EQMIPAPQKWLVATATDGSISNTIDDGWAVYGNQTVTNYAVFTAATPGTTDQLEVTLFQRFDAPEGHKIRQLRLWYTTDATPSLAGNWTVLTPSLATTTQSTTQVVIDALNNTVTFNGLPTAVEDYTVIVNQAVAGVTGFRLEVIPVAGYDGYLSG